MLDSCSPVPIWLIWKQLPMLEKLPFLVLCILGGYSFFFAITVVRLQNAASVQANGVRLSTSVRNLQRAIVATLYLTGFGIFAGLQFAFCIIGDGRVPIGFLVIRNLQLHFAFASNAFLILLIVHVVQWFVANRVNALRSQTNS